LFVSLYVLLGRRCPLEPRLYRQKAVCEREKVPFQSKIDLADDVIRAFAPIADTQTHVLFDSWYTCRRLWRAAVGRGWAITGGLKSNRKLRVNDPEQGRVYCSLAAYTARLTADDFTAVGWPHADGSARPVFAHLVTTFVKKLGACQVLIVRERLDQPLAHARFWATSDLTADLATVVSWAAQRWTIEQFIADVKEEFGTDHYQIRSAIGIVRFWHLAFLGYLYLEEERHKRPVTPGETAWTIGQTRCWQQKRHQRLLLDWIGARYADGLTSEQIDQLLVA
jgi:Transposase DDE domain